MAVQLASAYMQIIPSMKGFQGTVTKELVGVEQQGEKSGSRIGAGMSGGIRGRLLSALPNAGASIGNMFGGGLLGTIRRYAGPITGVVAGLISVEAIKKSMETFEATAASTRTLQRTIGGSAQSVSGFVAAMQLSGVESDKAGTAMRIFSKQVGLAGEDSKKAKKLTSELGFAFQDAHGKTLPMASLLPKLADKFQKMPDGAQKTALAMQLFGKSGTQMLPFLDKGSAGIAELTKKAQGMGLVIDDTSIKIFGAARVSLREFKAAAQGAGVAAGQDFSVALDGLANIGRAALIPVFNGLAKVFTALRPQFITIGEAADKIAQKLGAQLAPIVNRLAGQFIAFVQKADIGKWAETVSGGISRVVSAIGGLSGGGAVSAINGIVRGFSPLQAILQAIKPILPQIVSALGQAATTIGPVLATLATQVVSFITPLITSRAGILLLVGAFVGFKIVTGIITAIAAAARLAAAAQVVWNIAMSANPIGIIIVAIVAVVAALVWFFTQTKVGQQIWASFVGFLVQAWTNIVNVATTVWGAVAGAVGTAINAVRTVITTVVGAIVTAWNAYWAQLGAVVRTVFGVISGIVSGVMNVLRTIVLVALGLIIISWRGVWGLLGPIVRGALAAIIGFVTPIINGIRTVIVTVVAGIVTAWNRYWQLVSTGIRIVFNAIVGFVGPIINRIRAVIITVVSSIVTAWNRYWQIIGTALRTVWNAIVSTVTTLINRVRSVITSVVGPIVSYWVGVWNRIFGVVRDAWNKIVSAVSAAVGRVVSFVKGIGSKVVSAVSGFGSLLFNAGKNLIQGLINGVSAMVGGLVHTVTNIAGKAISAAKSALGIHSPSTVFHGIGQNLVAGFVNGITRGHDEAHAAIQGLSGNVKLNSNVHLAAAPDPAGLRVAGAGFPSTVTLVDKNGSLLGHMDARIDRYDMSQQLAGAR